MRWPSTLLLVSTALLGVVLVARATYDYVYIYGYSGKAYILVTDPSSVVLYNHTADDSQMQEEFNSSFFAHEEWTATASGNLHSAEFRLEGGAGSSDNPIPIRVELHDTTWDGTLLATATTTVPANNTKETITLSSWNTPAAIQNGHTYSFVYDIYAGPPPPAPISISFLEPLSGASSSDFAYWVLENNFPDLSAWNNATGTAWTWNVAYEPLTCGPDEIYNNSSTLLSPIATGTWPVEFAKSQPLWQPTIMPACTVNAYAKVYDGSGTLAASSSITFYITGSLSNASTSSSYPGTTSTLPVASTTITCNSGNWLGDNICGVLAFLFVPSTESLSQFSDLKTAVSSKPPFGYFSAIQSAIGALSMTATSTAIVDASTTTAFASVFGTLRNGMVWLLWLAFAGWVFYFARHIQL